MQDPRIILEQLDKRGVRFYIRDNAVCYDAPAGEFSIDDRINLSHYRNEITSLVQVRQAAIGLNITVPKSKELPILTSVQRGWIKAARLGLAPPETIPIILPLENCSYEHACTIMYEVLKTHDVLCYKLGKNEESVKYPQRNLPEEFLVSACHTDSPEDLAGCIQDFLRSSVTIDDQWSIKARYFSSLDGAPILIILVGHLVADGGSVNILRSEIESRAKVGGSAQPNYTETRTLADYAHWERCLDEDLSAHIIAKYWEEWNTSVPPLRNPATGETFSWRSGGATCYSTLIPASDVSDKREKLRRSGYSIFTLIMASLASSLAKWSGQSRFSIGAVGDLRTRPELSRTVGPLFCTDYLEVNLLKEDKSLMLLDRLTSEYQHATKLRVRPKPFAEMFYNLHQRVGAYINYVPSRVLEVIRYESAREDESIYKDSSNFSFCSESTTRWPILLRAFESKEGLMIRFEISDVANIARPEYERLIQRFRDYWDEAGRVLACDLK